MAGVIKDDNKKIYSFHNKFSLDITVSAWVEYKDNGDGTITPFARTDLKSIVLNEDNGMR